MSLIPGLGSLGPIGKLLDPGAIVKDVVNGVLPKNMGAVGDLAGAFVDFKMGNPVGAVQHAMEAIKDLPQAAKGLQGSTAHASNTNGRPCLEPPPPPLGSRAGKPFDFNELLSAIKALTAALTGQRSSGILGAMPKELREKLATESKTTTTATSTASSAARPDATTTPASTDADKSGAPAATEGRYRRGSATLQQDGQVRTPTHGSSGWVGQPQTPAPTSKSSSVAPAATSTPAAAPLAASAAPAPATTAPAGPAPAAAATVGAGNGAGQTITSVSQLQGMTDSAVKDAVMNGRIAPEVAKDQTAMMAIQQRMNAISEMNNLMTAMMRAVHDMQMAIIQNIRI